MHVLFNEGAQTIRHVPVDRHGRVTRVVSPSYSIVDLRRSEDDTDRTVQASTAATVDSASTTLTAAAGPSTSDARLLQVASASAFTEGHTYILRHEGNRESFVVHRKDTPNNRIYTQTDLRNAWASGASVLGVEISGTFPATEADDELELEDGAGPYLVLWDYSINSAGYLVPETIWLSRYQIPPFIDEQYVLQAFPSFARSVRGDGPSVQLAIKVAHDDYVSELEAAGIDPAYMIPSTFAKTTVRMRALEYLFRWRQTEPDTVEADRWAERFDNAIRNIHTGRTPRGTVKIDPDSATAPAGPDLLDAHGYLIRS